MNTEIHGERAQWRQQMEAEMMQQALAQDAAQETQRREENE